MEKVLYIIIVFILLIMIASIIYCYINIDVENFNINDKRIDKDIKILFLSDLHNRRIFNKLIDIINKEKPDIIICGGDMINESLHKTGNFIKLVNYIKDYKVYYVFGNHEEVLDEDKYNDYIALVNKTHVTLLNNKSVKISNNVILNGLANDIDTYKKFGKLVLDKEYIEDKLGKTNSNKYNILIAHNPLDFESYVSANYDLVLSGHVHGGVMILPHIGAILSPDYTFFPKYYNGLYKKNNTTMIVSRGIGFSERIPFRINDVPHVIIINLKKARFK